MFSAKPEQHLTCIYVRGGNGHFYEAWALSSTWTNANYWATNRGGYLATITSRAENDFIFNFIKDKTNNLSRHKLWEQTAPGWTWGPWVGGYRGADGSWSWVTGEPFAFQNWVPGEPDNLATQVHLAGTGVAFKPGDLWDGIDPSLAMPGYVIEYGSDPYLSSLQVIRRGTNQVEFTWERRRGRRYRVETANTLPSSSWDTVVGDSGTNIVVDTLPGAQRFYRLLVEPVVD
jgi:Lectin C-type domain